MLTFIQLILKLAFLKGIQIGSITRCVNYNSCLILCRGWPCQSWTSLLLIAVSLLLGENHLHANSLLAIKLVLSTSEFIPSTQQKHVKVSNKTLHCHHPLLFHPEKKKLQKKSKLKKVNLTWDFSQFFQKRHLASTPPEAYPCINCCFMQANSLSITQCLMSPCLEHDKSCWGGLVLSPSQSRKDLGLLPVQHLAGM